MNFYILWLSKVFNASNVELNKFLSILSPERAYKSRLSELKEFDFSPTLIERLLCERIKDEAKYDFEFCRKENIKLIDITSNEYPKNLLNILSPPHLLYCKGEILPKDEVSISVVGSRKCSEYGKICAKRFVTELSNNKITIVSGMAYGIDTLAHSYSISSGGRTIAVLGSGIDIIYPSENRNLYYKIIENGAVISEFPLHTGPIPKNFPIRNRIVAGISLGTLVIEAGEKSGSIITARLAGELGKDVYSVPGSIFGQNSVGTNLLIRDGAKVAISPKDILEDIYSEISKIIIPEKQISLFDVPTLNEEESLIYKKLSLTPISIDCLAENIDLPFARILANLSVLELNEYIKELPGKQYIINVK